MVVDRLKEVLEKKHLVEFKLYSLNYIIEYKNNIYIIYPSLYSNKKTTYNSFEELINNYTVYNESIIDNIDRVLIIEESEMDVVC